MRDDRDSHIPFSASCPREEVESCLRISKSIGDKPADKDDASTEEILPVHTGSLPRLSHREPVSLLVGIPSGILGEAVDPVILFEEVLFR